MVDERSANRPLKNRQGIWKYGKNPESFGNHSDLSRKKPENRIAQQRVSHFRCSEQKRKKCPPERSEGSAFVLNQTKCGSFPSTALRAGFRRARSG
jgi:hypothetical protein